MANRKDILNAALKALLAGVETSVWLKIPATFIAEIAGLSKDKQSQLAQLSRQQFEELLTQSDLATLNAATAAAGTQEIQTMLSNADKLTQQQFDKLRELTQEEFEQITSKLDEIDKTTKGTHATVKKIKSQLENISPGDQASDRGILVKGDAQANILENGDMVKGDQFKDCTININQPVAEPIARPGTIHNIPHISLGSLFKGREKDFDTLVTQLNDNTSTTAITQAISSLGGMGKTRLAVEYSWHAFDEGLYQAVLFVNCSQELAGKDDPADAQKQQNRKMSAFERLCVQMGQLAAPNLLNIPGADTADPQTALQVVLKTLQSCGQWLIVFDNVDEPEMAGAINTILPQLTKGKVIMTSRLSNFGGNIKTMPLEKLTPAASQEYLLDKTADKRRVRDNDLEKAKELAEKEKLDGLPVALEQAAAFINHRQISFEDYLSRFKVMEKKLLQFHAKESELDKDFKPVLTVWILTEEQLNPIARAVNTLAAFLAPDDIPTDLFIRQSESVFDVAGKLDSNFDLEQYKDLSEIEKHDIIEDAIAQLAAFSMITRDPSKSSFRIHRLVQEVTRLRLSRDHIEMVSQLILTMIHNDCPDYDIALKTNYAWHKTMDSHLRGLVVFIDQLWQGIVDFSDNIIHQLVTQINNLSDFYTTTNRFSEAEPLLERALAIDESNFGSNCISLAIQLNSLAQLYQFTNRLAEAEPLYERAAKILRENGSDSSKLAIVLNNLARLYQSTNRLAEAELLYQQAIKAFEDDNNSDQTSIAPVLNNLAMLYGRTNRLAEAELLYEQVLKIFEKIYGDNHFFVATVLNNLSQLYKATNRFSEAELMLERALAIDEASFGPDHPSVATELNNLANLYRSSNRFSEAEAFYGRALAIDEVSFGPDHPDVARDLNNLALLYELTNRLPEAVLFVKRVLQILVKFTRCTGHPHPHLMDAANNYTELLIQMGHSQAQATAKVIAMAPDVFGENEKPPILK